MFWRQSIRSQALGKVVGSVLSRRKKQVNPAVKTISDAIKDSVAHLSSSRELLMEKKTQHQCKMLCISLHIIKCLAGALTKGVFGVCLFEVPLCRTLFGTSTFKTLSTMRTKIRYLTSQREREREREREKKRDVYLRYYITPTQYVGHDIL